MSPSLTKEKKVIEEKKENTITKLLVVILDQMKENSNLY